MNLSTAEDRQDDFDKRLEELLQKLKNSGTGSGVDQKLLDNWLHRLEKCEKKSKKAKDLSKKNDKKIEKWEP
jgi:ABC-type uncharacterized transport system ATPase subunit